MAFQDLFVFVAILFAIAIAFLTGSYIVTQMAGNSYVNTTTTINGTSINPATVGLNLIATFDWGFMLILIGFTLSLIVAGYFIPSHPIFLLLTVILALVWLWISPGISNAYLTVIQSTPLSTLANSFPLTNSFFTNLPLIGLSIGILASILTHGKNPFAGG